MRCAVAGAVPATSEWSQPARRFIRPARKRPVTRRWPPFPARKQCQPSGVVELAVSAPQSYPRPAPRGGLDGRHHLVRHLHPDAPAAARDGRGRQGGRRGEGGRQLGRGWAQRRHLRGAAQHHRPACARAAARMIEHYIRDCGFVALRIEPFLWRKPPTDRAYYPLYAKAAELDVTFQTQVGHTGPLFPSETGRPTYIDEVALDFPELRIVCGHIGWPWTEEMIAVAWKHKNVWIDTSAHVPRHYPPAFVHFLRTFGKDKVCFATDYPLLRWDRVLPEVDALELDPEVKRRFLHDNAARAVKLAS